MEDSCKTFAPFSSFVQYLFAVASNSLEVNQCIFYTPLSMLSNLTKATVAKATKAASSATLRTLATRADLLAGHG
jgi:hypothetical protein